MRSARRDCHDDGVVAVPDRPSRGRRRGCPRRACRSPAFGIERHIADRAPRAVEMRGEGQAVDAAGRARQDRRRAPHAQTDAQGAEGRAHGLRLVMRTDRIVGGDTDPSAFGLARLSPPPRASSRRRRMHSRRLRRKRVALPGASGGCWRCVGFADVVGGHRPRASHRVVDDFEGRLIGRPGTCPPASPAVQHVVARPVCRLKNRPSRPSWSSGVGMHRRGSADIGGEFSNSGPHDRPACR
jgi:hypothetical protein